MSSGSGSVSGGGRGVPAEGGKIALYSLLVFKWHSERPLLLSAAVDVSSFPFFHRSTMKEHIIFHSRLIAARTPLGRRQVVEFENKIGHCHVYCHPSGLAITALSSVSYPMRVAFGLINEALRLFQEKCAGQWEGLTEDAPGANMLPEGADMLKKYQNPLEADKLLKVQRELDEVKDVMLKNIDELLQRGEKLDDLMQRSEDLSNTSYQFYRQAKKTNSCCSSLY
ncbi:VAMP-like protein YKT61 [Cyclospora cayetanensis]|uniref:VAMP-like protein YKT61 n=1 Tax=Cyclospora cayetanensis TaxID=88456 RepID=A0A6P6RR56_9EIME|nr:VAMP-like protein YKT61 [Cyclospora cayetanensis]